MISGELQASSCREIFRGSQSLEMSELNEVREIWLAFARKTVAHSDFKYISDLVIKKVSRAELREMVSKAKAYRQAIYEKLLASGIPPKRASELAQTSYARKVLQSLFDYKTQLRDVDDATLGARPELMDTTTESGFEFKDLKSMFSSLEASWSNLVKRVVFHEGGSLQRAKKNILIAGGRFKESYYWDTVFGTYGLLATNRVRLVFDQLENFVTDIQSNGFIFNGRRNYYSTRSQPPMVSVLVKNVFEGTRRWDRTERAKVDDYLTGEVLKALEKDYNEFWMNQRFDEKTGLNFHYDNGLNKARVERHSKDNEAELGETPLDVKAEAEYGTDFSEINRGRTSKILPVQLNALLFGYEKDLAWLYTMKAHRAETGGQRRNYEVEAARYTRLSQARRGAIEKYLLSRDGLFRNYDFEQGKQVEGVSGEIFSLLFAEALSQKQADIMIPKALELLDKPGGIAASNLTHSTKQWDGNHGWAPFQMMAIQGLKNYGYHKEATSLAKRWLQTVLNVYRETGQFYEKYDVQTMDLPRSDNTKYPNQVGFLWTNSSVIYVLELLGYRFE